MPLAYESSARASFASSCGSVKHFEMGYGFPLACARTPIARSSTSVPGFVRTASACRTSSRLADTGRVKGTAIFVFSVNSGVVSCLSQGLEGSPELARVDCCAAGLPQLESFSRTAIAVVEFVALPLCRSGPDESHALAERQRSRASVEDC